MPSGPSISVNVTVLLLGSVLRTKLCWYELVSQKCHKERINSVLSRFPNFQLELLHWDQKTSAPLFSLHVTLWDVLVVEEERVCLSAETGITTLPVSD